MLLLSDRCLQMLVTLGSLAAGFGTFYYGAVVGGIYKDPMMARFRQYGEEKLPYPICRFLESVGLLMIMLAIVLSMITTPGSYYGEIFPPLIFIVLAIMAFVSSYLLRQRPELAQMLPRWYAELLRDSTRQERRFLGFAWLRIPRQMRWRMNGDQQAFRVWSDMVRISVIYGARDPDDPWRMWV